jgi:enamine deaminase RidA (YjgF/YER057c/UK114 family)
MRPDQILREAPMIGLLGRGTDRSAVLAMLALGLVCTTASAQQVGAEARLKEKNITLPAPIRPVASFVEWTRVGNLLFLAGHIPGAEWRGKGKVGKDVTVEQGQQAARETGLALLATTRDALGSLDKVKRVVRTFGMVNSAPGFVEQARVIDGCSNLMIEVFGETYGKGTRAAVGMAELPFNIPVEIEMILEVAD